MSGLWRYLGNGDPNDTYGSYAESSGPPVTPFAEKWRDRLEKIVEVAAFCEGVGVDPAIFADHWERLHMDLDKHLFTKVLDGAGRVRWEVAKGGRNWDFMWIYPAEKMVCVEAPNNHLVEILLPIVDGTWRWGYKNRGTDLLWEPYWKLADEG